MELYTQAEMGEFVTWIANNFQANGRPGMWDSLKLDKYGAPEILVDTPEELYGLWLSSLNVDNTTLQVAFKELWRTKQKEYSIKNQISKYLAEYAEANRKYQPGDIVEVYDEFDVYHGDGVIGEVRTSLYIDELSIKDYGTGKETIDDKVALLRYEVYAKTKKGIASKKHFYEHPHFMVDYVAYSEKAQRRGWDYIKPKS